MYLAKPYLKENAQILDPCCGVGTMLIERDILVPAREKYGIDIFGDAIDMARENAALAGEKINFIHRDYFDFKHDYKFDEIVTNMPVKGKKAKEDMDSFYARFFEKSKSLLAEDGIIIMYSNEVGFVKTAAAAAVLQADSGVYDPEKGFVLSVYYRNEITI